MPNICRLNWGITFDGIYTVAEKSHRKVAYADKQTLEQNIVRKHSAVKAVDEDTDELLETPTGTLHTHVAEPPKLSKRPSHVRL